MGALYALRCTMFHSFMKHKLLLLNSVKYLKDSDYIVDNGDINIEERINKNYLQSEKILNLIIKLHTSNNLNILQRVQTMFEYIEQNEIEILNHLLFELCKHDNDSLYLVKDSHKNEWYFKKDKIDKLIVRNDEYIKQVFTGDSIKVYANKDKEYGKIKINIDGKNEEIIDLCSEYLQKDKLIYDIKDIKYTNHILNIYPVKNSLINISKVEFNSNINQTDDNILEFVGFDNQTKGNWINKYGNIGYDIFYQRPNLPDTIVILYKFYGDYYYHEIFESDYDNQSAIMLPDKSNRIIPNMDNEFAMYIDIAVTSDKPVIISFYLLNYTGTVKKQNIKIININNNEEVYSLSIENYYEGIYYSFKIKGIYRFCFDNGAKNIGIKTTSPINGVFID